MRLFLKDLKPRLDLINSCASPNAIIPIHEDMRIGYIDGFMTFETNNGQSFASTKVPVKGNPERFYRTVSSEKFARLIKTISCDHVDIDVTDPATMKVKSDSGEFSLGCSDWKSFEVPNGEIIGSAYDIDVSLLTNGIKAVSWAIEKATLSQFLRNVHLSNSVICAASTSCFAFTNTELHPDLTALLPYDSLGVFKAMNVSEGQRGSCFFSKKHMIIDSNDVRVGILLSADKYPDLKSFLKEELPNVVDVSKSDLKSMVNRMLTLTNSAITNIEVSLGELIISGSDPIYGNQSTERVEVGRAEHFKAVINSKNFQNAINSIPDSDITIRYKDSQTYIQLEGQDVEVILTAIVDPVAQNDGANG